MIPSTDVLIPQRAELTFKHNRGRWRHGWIRLTPAYSVKVVNEILHGIDRNVKVLDPFSGTATTALCANGHGIDAETVDINPFLIWLAETKLHHYSNDDLSAFDTALSNIKDAVARVNADRVPNPPLSNIDRWWPADALVFLCKLKFAIEDTSAPHTVVRSLLDVVFCRLIISLSNAAFNHQSMSFKDASGDLFGPRSSDEFVSILARASNDVRNTVQPNPIGDSAVTLDDARSLEHLQHRDFDVLITSPPYPNRMSYIRELRPYMYWLGFLRESADAGELDWKAIGGTWGVATSRVADWSPDRSIRFPTDFNQAVKDIALAHARNGRTMSNYVAKYFEDMFRHIHAVHPLLRKGGRVHYIVGNSLFYGIPVDSDRIYVHMLRKAGFSNVTSRVIRKRNSKKELFEYDVSAQA